MTKPSTSFEPKHLLLAMVALLMMLANAWLVIQKRDQESRIAELEQTIVDLEEKLHLVVPAEGTPKPDAVSSLHPPAEAPEQAGEGQHRQ